MATQSPNNNITIKVSNIQAATSVNADGGSIWKQIVSASTTLSVHNKLYIKYANVGGTYKNNVIKVTDNSGHELAKTPDNSNQYTVVTIPNGTTVVNIEYVSILENDATTFTLVFNVKNLSNSTFNNNDKINFNITGINNEVVKHVEVSCKYGSSKVIIDNGTGGIPTFYIKNVSATNNYVVSFFDGLNWQNNDRNNSFSFKPGTSNYIDIYVCKLYDAQTTIAPAPYILNINHFNNPQISYYYNTMEFDSDTYTFNNFIKKELHDISNNIVDNKFIINGAQPSYNSTFTKSEYVNCPITFRYNTPFRIDSNGNTINSELVTGTATTYQVTFNLVRNSKLPYYASNQEYRVNINPYTRKFKFNQINDYNANIRFTYTVNTGSPIQSNTIPSAQTYIDIYTHDMFEKNHTVVFNNIWAYTSKEEGQSPVIDSSYFCPYININNTKYMCYNGFNYGNALNLSGTPPIVTAKLFKYDIVKPKIVVPTVPNKLNLKLVSYSCITSTASPKPITDNIKKYQFQEDTRNNLSINGDVDLDYWSNYGYNVNNNDYKLNLELNSTDKINYADDFDVVLNNKKLTYMSTGSNKTFTIKPNSTTNKYFSESPDIYVYPKTSIKYINNLHDDEGLNINIRLNYSIDGINKTSLINGGNTFETERFTYYNNAKHKLIIDNISTKNPIDYIQVNWPGGSRKINGINDSSVLLINDYLTQPITWNSPSITYTFTVVTKQPSTQPQQRYDYGIEIDGNNLPSDVGSLSISLISDDYKIKSYSEGTLNGNSNNLTLDNIQVYNSQVIYIDKTDCTNNTTFEPKVQLYNYNTNYYIVPSVLPSNYIETSDSTCLYKGTIKLSDYISNNIAYAYKSQIKFKPIGIKYNAYLNILNKDNTVVEKISTGTVSPTQDTIISIPDDYVGDTYNVAISNIIGISNTGNEFPIERYNLNLVNLSGESTSYNIYKPIKVNNNNDANVIIKGAYFLENNNWNRHDMFIGVIPSQSNMTYIYQTTYISPIWFESNSSCHVTINYKNHIPRNLTLEFNSTYNMYIIIDNDPVEDQAVSIEVNHI